MQIIGQLSELSLAKLFQFVEQIYKTGLLLLQPELKSPSQLEKDYYIWFQEGRIVAAAEQLDHNCLLSMIKQRGWLKSEQINLTPELSSSEQSLGLHLKAKGTLTDEQLQAVFHAQVIQPVCALFKIQDGRFVFDTKATLPKIEMTGLSLSASEATLLGLRVLRDWSAFAAKFPDPTHGLYRVNNSKPHLQLDSQERQVWELADGKICLRAIAVQLQLPMETVQQIALRMKIVGLVETLPLITNDSQKPMEIASAHTGADQITAVNPSLMKNLVNLLNTKIV